MESDGSGQSPRNSPEVAPIDRLAKIKSRKWVNRYVTGIEEKPDYIVACSSGVVSDLDRQKILDRTNRFKTTAIELGSGSGGHLLARAALNPETLWIGFELRFKRTFRTAEKAEQAGLQNLIVVHTRAEAIDTIFPKGSLAGIYVNFPDPWEKQRQIKHRLLKPEFLDRALPLLAPATGIFSYKTDHEPNFERVYEHLKIAPQAKLTKHTRDLHKSEWAKDVVWTEFERLFYSQGKPICMLEATNS
jgi:tRNA (guanine-N7-)-methyltransferase